MSSIFLSTNCAGSVYSFQINSHQKVILKHERQGKGSSFYLEDLGQRPFHIKINDVIMPDGLKALLNDSNNSLFSRLYPRIVKLSDGTLKLYLNFRLLGGMISDEQNFRLLGETIPDEHNEQPKPRVNIIDLLQKTPEVKNSSIKDFVRYNLPLNTFSVVSVKSVNYSFGGLRA
ncbi:MAG: hypothetical protein KBA81_07275, partial [Rhabdochlamydiaceae bacterium]|nr:hypothetical protein [Rhabdochlamydiaceae bacterium]